MTGGKRLRIAALFVIVLVFAFIMDMSSNAITCLLYTSDAADEL